MAYREIYEKRLQKFLAKVYIDNETKCMIWTGSKTIGGYGVVGFRGKRHVAHKAFWLFLNKTIPDGYDLDHLCRNRACINPEHLEPVTRSTNLRRGFESRGCKNGHEVNDENFTIINRKDGSFERRCKICHRERNKKCK